MVSHPLHHLLLIAALAAPAAAWAARPDNGTETAVQRVLDAGDTTPVRLADNDDDDDDEDGCRRVRSRHDRGELRRARDHHRGDYDDDDGEAEEGARSAPRRTAPAPVQNPLIGAPRATVNRWRPQ